MSHSNAALSMPRGVIPPVSHKQAIGVPAVSPPLYDLTFCYDGTISNIQAQLPSKNVVVLCSSNIKSLIMTGTEL